MMPALHNAEWLQPAQGRSLECLAVKGWMDETDVMGQAVYCVLIEQSCQGDPFLNRMRGGREPWRTDRCALRQHPERYVCSLQRSQPAWRGWSMSVVGISVDQLKYIRRYL